MKKRIFALLLTFCLLFAASLPALAEGEGTGAAADAAVEIHDRAGLEAIAQNPAGSYVLMADIDMKDAPWTPIAFSGTLDGGGHTLYNLSITAFDPETAVSVDGNDLPYDTLFAAFFSRASGATIENLHLLGVDVDVATGENAFAAGLVGWAENVTISGCSVRGAVILRVGGVMNGIAGLVGFGYGTATNSEVDVTLTLVDENQAEKCEEFLGGILATGYLDIENCTVKVRGYTSVYGYVHNGGVAGMYFVHTDDSGHAGYIRNTASDAEIYFFEANEDRRAYCDPILGEQLNWTMELAGNTTLHFVDGETTDYSKILLPEMCENPVYTDTVAEPSCEGFGYTTHTCESCGYSYDNDYLAPAHEPDEWVVVTAPAAGQPGLRTQSCLFCGALLGEESFTALSALTLSESSVRLQVGKTLQLAATTEPADAAGNALVYTSSDEAVATVDEAGNITALAPGRAQVTCTTADGTLAATCDVTVPGTFPLWAIILIAAAAIVVIIAIVLILGARRRKKRRARRAAQRRQVYTRR